MEERPVHHYLESERNPPGRCQKPAFSLKKEALFTFFHKQIELSPNKMIVKDVGQIEPTINLHAKFLNFIKLPTKEACYTLKILISNCVQKIKFL